MFRNMHFYWFIPLLIASVVAVAVVLMDIQIGSFRDSYFNELKAEIRKSDALTVEVFKAFLSNGNPEGLKRFFESPDANPMIVQIRARGGTTMFETPNAPPYLRQHLRRPRVRALLRGAEHEDVAIEFNPWRRVWMAYHSIRFQADGREYRLVMAEVCGSVSRLIRLSEFAIIGLSSFGLLIVAGLIFYFFRLIRSPLSRLLVSTREIASGNLDAPVYVPKSGAVREIALCVRDMAEHLKGRIAELKKLENCRGEFITAISHAMKTPVTAILSAVEGIEQGALENPEYREECVRALNIQSRRLAVLLHDFLTLTALELQELKPDRDLIPLVPGETLRNAAAVFRNAHPEVETKERIATDAEIAGDPNLLEQAFANLLVNAVAHGGARHLELEITETTDTVEIRIQDDGCGIAPEYLDKLFERFYRVPSPRKPSERVHGNGLGLAIVKHIVALHRGAIRVISEPGRGTAFFLSFPKLP